MHNILERREDGRITKALTRAVRTLKIHNFIQANSTVDLAGLKLRVSLN
jgi:hypothetical protein